MINKIIHHALETQYDGIKLEVISPFAIALIHQKVKLLKKGVMLSDSLINEIEDFVNRNDLVKSEFYLEEANSLYKCCPNCLKAHALVKAREFGFNEESIKILSTLFKGDIGHYGGYYLDGDELIKIQ